MVPTASSPKLWSASRGVSDRVRITVLATVRFFRFPAPTSELSLFPCSFVSMFANRPLTLRSGSSVLVRISFRVPSLSWLPLHLSMEAVLAQGFGPLRDFTCVRPQFVRIPSPLLRSTLRLSQPSGGFLRTLALRAYFVPLPRPGFLFLFRGLSPRMQPSFLVESLAAPLPFSSS